MILDRLSRRTSSGRFIPEIDGLRFIAISCVVMFHLSGFVQVAAGSSVARVGKDGLAQEVLSTGHYGVQLFFVISGFILALPFALQHLDGAPRVRLGAYLLRRLTRLEPPYIICMVAFAALMVVRHQATVGEILPSLAASLGYVHAIIYGEATPINVVAWSLEVEVQFYLLAPLLCLVFLIRPAAVRRCVLAVAVIGLTLSQMQWMEADTRWALSLAGHLQYFLVGLLLADVYVVIWKQKPATAPWWDLVSLIGWPLLVVVWMTPSITEACFPWLAFALYCAAFAGPWSRRAFSNPWIVVIGGMCYTIYLLHYPLLGAVGRKLHQFAVGDGFVTQWLSVTALFLPILMTVSVTYFVLIERPCMDRLWPQKLLAWVRGASRP